MLNTFKIGGNTTSAKVSFNSPSTGIIQKSHPKSRFIRCHAKSNLADWIMGFDQDPHLEIKDKNYTHKTNDVPVTVLQLMVFGSDELIVEIVNNDDLKDIDTPTTTN